MSYSKTLANYAAHLKYEDLPRDVIEQAKLLTLHTLGVCLAACPTEIGKKAIALSKDIGGDRNEATIIGDGSKVACVQAGFANGTLADILDWEDCSWTGHPSACAIPTALAVGERVRASGKNYITAVVAGYELHERIGMAAQPSEKWDYLDRGWAGQSWGIFASAIPAAKLLRLSKEQMENAIALAGTFTPIVTTRPHLARTDFAKYRWGMNCLNGIVAALIAKSGGTPIPNFLDGKSGAYWKSFSDKCDWEWYTKNLGKDYLIMETYLKHWPTNMWINQPLDGIDAIMKNHKIKPEDVDKIIVRPTIQFRMVYRPEGYRGILDAEFSVPYCIAVLMHEPDPGPNWYTEERMKDPKILELAGKVKAEGPLMKLNENFQLFQAGRYPPMSVEVKTRDGRLLKQDVPFPKGHPKNRMTIEEFKDRFRRAASFVLRLDKIEKAIDRILKLEEVEDMSEIGDLMHG